MAYGSDDRDDNRWRDRDDRNAAIAAATGAVKDAADYGRGDDDRGFFDRAGDEVRSWFGDDEAQRRREMDERRWAQRAEDERRPAATIRAPAARAGWAAAGATSPARAGTAIARACPEAGTGIGRATARAGSPARSAASAASAGADPPAAAKAMATTGSPAAAPASAAIPTGRFDRNDPGAGSARPAPMGQRFAGYGGHEEVTRGGRRRRHPRSALFGMAPAADRGSRPRL